MEKSFSSSRFVSPPSTSCASAGDLNIPYCLLRSNGSFAYPSLTTRMWCSNPLVVISNNIEMKIQAQLAVNITIRL
ncbi:hypothetical protein TIFTF001_041012 [Ficus carica]|uniref:Uncharacterized protein n=1 Tax=Ficus carica TaxID=3494 RepID=A0AA88CS25_FICCA|nr:hypothetical protein TIFTF001_041012 [Ficus carica]